MPRPALRSISPAYLLTPRDAPLAAAAAFVTATDPFPSASSLPSSLPSSVSTTATTSAACVAPSPAPTPWAAARTSLATAFVQCRRRACCASARRSLPLWRHCPPLSFPQVRQRVRRLVRQVSAPPARMGRRCLLGVMELRLVRRRVRPHTLKALAPQVRDAWVEEQAVCSGW